MSCFDDLHETKWLLRRRRRLSFALNALAATCCVDEHPLLMTGYTMSSKCCCPFCLAVAPVVSLLLPAFQRLMVWHYRDLSLFRFTMKCCRRCHTAIIMVMKAIFLATMAIIIIISSSNIGSSSILVTIAIPITFAITMVTSHGHLCKPN